MNRELGTVLGVLIGGMFATLAVAALGFAGWMTVDNLHVLATFRAAEGEVKQVSLSSAPGARFAVHRVEVLYRACPEPPPQPVAATPFVLPPPMGRLYNDRNSECLPGERGRRRVSVDASGPTTLEPGDAVMVYWHPEHPRKVHVAAFSTFWFIPCLLTVFGLPLAWYGGQILRDLIKDRRQPRSTQG